MSGDAVIKGRSFTVEQNPAQVIESLNMVWMSYMQAYKGPLTLFNDTIYADRRLLGLVLRLEAFLAPRQRDTWPSLPPPTTSIGRSRAGPCTR